jgi:hypothetical protein
MSRFVDKINRLKDDACSTNVEGGIDGKLLVEYHFTTH